jgi:hypothetical protein
MYFIVPEWSMPSACREREYTEYVPGERLLVTLPDTR